MKKVKKLIIILSIVLIIMIISIIILNKKIKRDNQENIKEYAGDVSQDFIGSLDIVDGYSTFFEIEQMLYNYVIKIEYNNAKAIYNLLDDTYISENNITQENVLEYISDVTQYASEVKIMQIYEQTNAQNKVYYIDCFLEKQHERKEFYFTIYTDETNLTYSIEPINKQTFDKKIINTSKKLGKKTIEKNKNNKTTLINPTEEEIVTKYFEDFLDNALYYPEYAYNLLNEKYKEKCFPTLKDFTDYIESNRQQLELYDVDNLKSSEEFETVEEYRQYMYSVEMLEIDKYQIRNQDDYNRYICIDNQGNYYTFYATYPYNYTVVLGNYVVPTEDFIDEYNASTDAGKVVLNIKRFFMGIDDKNYGYSYNVLSEGFKQNKYPTKQEFINYAKQNFFDKNEIEYISYKKENGVYIYEINIKDATGKSSEIKEFNIIVKLNEGTDFEMSFGSK